MQRYISEAISVAGTDLRNLSGEVLRKIEVAWTHIMRCEQRLSARTWRTSFNEVRHDDQDTEYVLSDEDRCKTLMERLQWEPHRAEILEMIASPDIGIETEDDRRRVRTAMRKMFEEREKNVNISLLLEKMNMVIRRAKDDLEKANRGRKEMLMELELKL